jgi:dephospho-CoA kinase
MGATVIDTDIIARQVVAAGQPALEAIRATFGDAVLNEDGTLDRGAMRQLIFADDEARQRLETILHPRIQVETLRQAEDATGPYSIIVVPLLADSPLRAEMDRILVVDCDEDTQIKRLLARDAESEAQARRILAAQASREERLAIADDVIENNSTFDALAAEVSALHDSYIALANLPAG